MPLFKSSDRPTNKHDTRARSSSPERKRGFFSTNNRSSAEPDQAKSKTTGGRSGTGIFARSSSPGRKRGIFSSSSRTSTSSSESDRNKSKRTGGRSGTGIFRSRRRNRSRAIDHDPSIINARQKVSEAEEAENDADRALLEARNHVRLAREHVHTLEQEAIEGSRIAQMKQAEAKVIHKSAKSLGRHGS